MKKKMMERALAIWAKWNELLLLPIALVVLWVSGPVLRMFDPTAAVFDWGILQVYFIAMIGTLFAVGFTRLMLKLFSPNLEKFIDVELPKIWQNKEVSVWKRAKLAVFFFCFYLLVFVLLAKIL
jgi:hypothetical protein